jgi:hypothetical protein
MPTRTPDYTDMGDAYFRNYSDAAVPQSHALPCAHDRAAAFVLL